MLFSNRLYQVLKFVALVLLPAFGALYVGLADIWNLPEALKVVGTLTAIDAFLGVLLKISTNAYNKQELYYDGNLAVVQKDDEDAELHLTSVDVKALREKNSVVFKIDRE